MSALATLARRDIHGAELLRFHYDCKQCSAARHVEATCTSMCAEADMSVNKIFIQLGSSLEDH